ncbi:MAG: hypothetical protein ACREBG_13260 [Pyrinomonadaceae bacterium]
MSDPFKICCGDAELSVESESILISCPHGIARIGLLVRKDESDALRTQLQRVRELVPEWHEAKLLLEGGSPYDRVGAKATVRCADELEAALKEPVREGAKEQYDS